MKYHHIQGIDKAISRLVQGTVYFTDQQPDEAFALFDAAFEQGCNIFDTAHGYRQGACERVLGSWIRERNIRDAVVILGKGAHPYEGHQRVTPENIMQDLYESLERLQVDCIDLYVLHRDDPTQAVEAIMDCLYEHHQAGLITAIGGSNWTHERLQEANDYAQKHNLLPFVASSPQMSLAKMVKPTWGGCISVGYNEAAQEWYRETGMALLTWSSLAGGFMTGKYTPDNLDDFEDYFDEVTITAYAYSENFERLDRARQLAEKYNITLPQLALAYVLNLPLNIFTIIGSKTAEEFKENAIALEVELSQDEINWLEWGD